LRTKKLLLVAVTFAVVFSMMTVDVSAVTWTRATSIYCWDNQIIPDNDYVSLITWGDHVEDHLGKYFRKAEHKVTFVRIAPHHTITNVVLRGYTENYDVTETRSTVSQYDVITINEGRGDTSGIGTELDFDATIPIYWWFWIIDYHTIHVSVEQGLDPYWEPEGPTILDFP
jgi:hypothetical protein